MSRQLGMDCICCRPTPRPAHIEYSMQYHTSLVRRIAGETAGDGAITEDMLRRFYDAWDYDLLWRTHDGFVDWSTAGRCTDMGHADYAENGSDRRAPKECPFSEVEQVWDFDPVKEYGLTSFDELAAGYEKYSRERCEAFPNQVCSGGYYKTVISGAIQVFGWDMLLLAAADEGKFARVLERFGEYTLHHTRAWSQTSVEAFIQHDDIVWTAGPFMRPGFYREVLFPIYRELWKPLKAAGKKVLFCSDGTVEMFLEDIAACGADGFIFEPSNNLDRIVATLGGRFCLSSSKADCRTMTFGTWEEVQAQIDATLALTRGRPGFMFAVGNHIPANVSDEMCLRYMDYLRKCWGA